MSYLNGEACSSKIRGTVVAVLILAVIVFTARSVLVNRDPLKEERESFRLGTIVKVTVYGLDKAKLEKAVNSSMLEISRLEKLFSVNIPTSDIACINAQATDNRTVSVPVHRETEILISRACKWAYETDGSFDPTIGPVVNLWGIGTKHARVPGVREIKDALKRVNYKFLRPFTQKTTAVGGASAVSYTAGIGAPGMPKMSIDLGGIAKGDIADRITQLLKGQGIKSALIDLGGNIAVVGRSPSGKPWKLGIQHPDKPRGEYFAVVEAEDISLVTSGPYERYLKKDGRTYHHIFDPATGYPAESDLLSVTVAGKSSADADALCTALFVMGYKKAVGFLLRHKEIEAVLAVRDGDKRKIVITPGLKDRFRLTDMSMTSEVMGVAGK